MNRIFFAAALAATAFTATSASALTPLVGAADFRLKTELSGPGIPSGIALLTGRLDYDSLFNQTSTAVSNFNVTFGGQSYGLGNGINVVYNSQNGSTGTLVFSNAGTSLFAFNLTDLYSAGSSGPPPSGGNTTSIATNFNYGGYAVSLDGGSKGELSLAAAPAVPEPATWAMMIAGFGMVGFALRSRRQQSVRVTYA